MSWGIYAKKTNIRTVTLFAFRFGSLSSARGAPSSMLTYEISVQGRLIEKIDFKLDRLHKNVYVKSLASKRLSRDTYFDVKFYRKSVPNTILAKCTFETCSWKVPTMPSASVPSPSEVSSVISVPGIPRVYLPPGLSNFVNISALRKNRPLTFFIGSCYQAMNDTDNRYSVKKAYRKIPNSQGFNKFQPHANIFLGDQVYLDNPVFEWDNIVYNLIDMTRLPVIGKSIDWIINNINNLPRPLRRLMPIRLNPIKKVENKASERYKLTVGNRLKSVYANAGNFFLADDHEFWNNYPFTGKSGSVGSRLSAILVYPALFTNPKIKRIWKDNALKFFKAFQTNAKSAQFKSKDISFLMLDTRQDRKLGRTFLTNSNEVKLQTWIKNLSTPGVLVMSQILFDEEGEEENLPKFKQYYDIVKLLRTSQHDVVLISGDVHYGRIASTDLNPNAKLYEVITSPMRLVDPIAGSNSTDPSPPLIPAKHRPTHFPDKHLHHTPQSTIHYDWTSPVISNSSNYSHDNFCVIEFFKKPNNNGKITLRTEHYLLKKTSAIIHSQGKREYDLS